MQSIYVLNNTEINLNVITSHDWHFKMFSCIASTVRSTSKGGVPSGQKLYAMFVRHLCAIIDKSAEICINTFLR